MAVSLVDCCPGHVSSVQAFFARMYKPEYVLAVNDDLFRWQFAKSRNGSAGRYHLKLALLDEQVIGCIGYTPVEVSLGAQIVSGAWLANWMVNPDHRRLGIGPLLVREVMRQFDVTLNLGPNRDARDILSRMGWESPRQLPRYIRVLDPEGVTALTETGAFHLPADAGQTRAGAAPGPFRVAVTSRFDNEATELWDRLQGARPSRAGARRSAAFLNWRYMDHPVFHYRGLEVHESGKLTGFAVYRVEQVRGMDVRVARLVELVCEDSPAGDSLVRAVLDDARSQAAVMLDFFCMSRDCPPLLDRHGFISGESEPGVQIPILFQPLDRGRTGIFFMTYLRNLPEASTIADWYVTKADADQDRPN